MLCQGQDDHTKLLACRKIPYRVQRRLDKVEFESDADREIARTWIRSERKLDSLRENWQIFARDSPLTEQGNQALRASIALEDEGEFEGAGLLHWLTEHRNAGCCCCCTGCHRKPKTESSVGMALVAADQSPRLSATIAAEAGDVGVCKRNLQSELLPQAEARSEKEQGFTVK